MNTATPNLADLLADFYCESSYRQIKWQIYPPPQLSIDPMNTAAPNLADLPTQVQAYNGEEWPFQISIVKAHIGRSSGRFACQIYPPVVQCIMRCILWDAFGSHLGFFKKRWGFAFNSE